LSKQIAAQPTGTITLLRNISDRRSKKLMERKLPENSSPSHYNSSAGRRKAIVYPMVLACLVFAVFSNTLTNGFVFDDTSMIENNAAIRDSKYVRAYFMSPFFSVGQPVKGPILHDYYRPMVFVSYLANYSLHGLSAMAWHATNILLHVAVVMLLYLLFNKLKLGPGASLVAAALFAVHPAIADSVAGISGRSDPLCAIFFLASLACYISARQSRSVWGLVLLACSCVFFAGAVLTKENAIALPILLAAYEIFRPDAIEKRKLRFLCPFAVIAVTYVLWRSYVVPMSMTFSGGILDLALRLMAAAEISISYLLIAVFPHELGFETFTQRADSIADPRALVSTVAVFLCAGAIARLSRRFPRACFLTAWFFICLTPFFYFFLFHPGAEFFTPPHFLYFPLIGVAGLAGIGAARLAELAGAGGKKLRGTATLAATGCIVILFSFQTFERNTLWRDNFTFFTAMTKHAPRSPRTHIGMGNSFLMRDMPGYALSEYAAAWELARSEPNELFDGTDASPGSDDRPVVGRVEISNYYAAGALTGMGDAYSMLGETDNAIAAYRGARSENAFDATIHEKLARAYESKGLFDEAIDSYERALRIDRRLLKAAASLEIARGKKTVYEKAIRVYEKSLKNGLTDSAESLYTEALIARLSDEERLAEALFRMAIEKDPMHFGANMALGRILFERGECEIALGNFGLAFASRPASALAAYELAVTNLAIRDTLAAEQWAAKAYDLAPDPYYWDFLQGIRDGTKSEREN
jgi:tetratricopeptide (TPR) repeat protein